MIRKWLAIGIILLFVGVTIEPTIAQSKREELLSLYDAGIITADELQQRLKPIVQVMQ
jgi:hypothetical protein